MRTQEGFTPYVSMLGQGDRKVLALHCTMAFSGAWFGFLKAAGEDLTFIAPDMPSHGASVDWDEVSDFSETVYQATCENLTEPMDVIGHSFGGAIALRLLIERPELVRSVTMIEPVFFCAAALDVESGEDVHDKNAAEFLVHLKQGNRLEAAKSVTADWSDGSAWESLPDNVRATMARGIHVVPDTLPFINEDARGLLPRLSECSRPVLLIRGSTSPDIVEKITSALVRRIPGAQSAVIDGAGHMAPLSHSKATAAVWRRFLDDLD